MKTAVLENARKFNCPVCILWLYKEQLCEFCDSDRVMVIKTDFEGVGG